MARFKLLFGAGALALASLMITPATSAQAAEQTCHSDELCLSDPDGLQAVVPEGRDVDFDPAIGVDIFYNGTDSDAHLCGSLCITIPAHRLQISRGGQLTVTSVDWP